MSKNNSYKIGDKFYRYNKKTKELEELEIANIQYVFNRKIGSRANFTIDEIHKLLEDKVITANIDILKREAISKLEEQFGIKLKEV